MSTIDEAMTLENEQNMTKENVDDVDFIILNDVNGEAAKSSNWIRFFKTYEAAKEYAEENFDSYTIYTTTNGAY